MQTNKSQRIATGLPEQTNDPAVYAGVSGFWVQGECVFLPARSPEEAIERYRQKMTRASISISHNFGCAAIQDIRRRFPRNMIPD